MGFAFACVYEETFWSLADEVCVGALKRLLEEDVNTHGWLVGRAYPEV